MWIFPLILLVLFEATADIFSKEYTLRDKLIWALCALFLYVIGNIFWIFALKDGAGLARGAAIFSVASAILAVFIGMLMYKETVTTLEWVGIGLGVISLIFIFWHEIFV